MLENRRPEPILWGSRRRADGHPARGGVDRPVHATDAVALHRAQGVMAALNDKIVYER